MKVDTLLLHYHPVMIYGKIGLIPKIQILIQYSISMICLKILNLGKILKISKIPIELFNFVSKKTSIPPWCISFCRLIILQLKSICFSKHFFIWIPVLFFEFLLFWNVFKMFIPISSDYPNQIFSNVICFQKVSIQPICISSSLIFCDWNLLPTFLDLNSFAIVWVPIVLKCISLLILTECLYFYIESFIHHFSLLCF